MKDISLMAIAFVVALMVEGVRISRECDANGHATMNVSLFSTAEYTCGRKSP